MTPKLPPLPEAQFCAWMLHGKAVNAFNHGIREGWDYDGYWAAKGFSKSPLYTADQLRSAQLEAWKAAMECAAQKLQELIRNHCEGTQKADDQDDWCHEDNRDGCEFVSAWREGMEAIRSLPLPE